MADHQRVSLGYGVVMGLVLVFATFVTMRFSLSVREAAEAEPAVRFMAVAVDFFLIFLVAVSLGFTSLFMKLDTLRCEHQESMDRLESLLERLCEGKKAS